MATKRKHEQAAQAPETDALLEAAQIAVEEGGKLKEFEAQGSKAAESMIDGEVKRAQSRIEILVMVCSLETRAAAVAYHKGFKATAEKKTESKNAAIARCADTVLTFASQMNRAIGNAFGLEKKDEQGQHVFPKYEDGKPASKETTLKILQGKGSWQDKVTTLAALKASGAPPKDGGKGTTPIQKRIDASVVKSKEGEVTAAPAGVTTLARVLNVRASPNTKDDAEKKAEIETASREVLLASIKVMPEALIGPVGEAWIARMMVSSNRFFVELASNVRDHWQKQAQQHAEREEREQNVKHQVKATAATK